MNCLTCIRVLPPDSGRYVCRGCQHHLRYVLLTLAGPELALLRAALVPGGGGPSTGTRFGGRAHSPMPADARALDLLGPGTPMPVPDPHGEQSAGIPLGPIIVGWADSIAREHQAAYRRGGTEYLVPCTGAAPRTGSDLEAWCRWLAAYVPYAVTRPWAGEMIRELEDALDRVRAITGTQPRTHHRYAPCPWCSAFAVTHTDGRWEFDCQACGRTLDPDEYAAHAAAVMPGWTALLVHMTAAALTHRAAGAPDESHPGATPLEGPTA